MSGTFSVFLPPSTLPEVFFSVIMYRITKPKPDGTLVLWKGRLQPAVEIALQTITIAKESVPLEPVKGALGSLAALLNLLQVSNLIYSL